MANLVPYNGMTLNIPYGSENARVMFTSNYIQSLSYSFSTTDILGWSCNNEDRANCYRYGYAFSESVSETVQPALSANFFIKTKRVTIGSSGSSSFMFYFTCSDDLSYPYDNVIGGECRQGTSPASIAFDDIYMYRDDNYVYIWVNNISGLISSNCGYINHPCKIPLEYFYEVDYTPDPSVFYRVRPSWKSLIDPNDSAGESTSGGGNGSHDDSSDTITLPSIPNISAAQAGVITLFKPSIDNLKSLNNYLWTNVNDFIENIQKFFSNPMDYIIAFNIFPVNPAVGVERNIKLGLWETTVIMPPILSQWYEFPCGSIFIPEYWGSALDYAPNTKISCMLPFIGVVQLNTDEVMGKNLDIKYRIDLLSGSCVAILSINGSVYYQFTGECGVSIPLTGADWSRVYSAAIGAIGTAISGGLSAGASGAITQAGFQASNMLAAKNGMQASKQFANAINDVKKYSKGAPALRDSLNKASQAARDTAISAANSGNVGNAIRASRVASTVNNTVGSVMGGKVSIQHSGTISGSAGLLGVRRPFIIIEYPNQSLAENYKHFVGYPSNIFAKLSDVSGYTECEQVIVENFPGTDNEYAEMLEALKGGVYL